ncbi:RNA polymerase sigma factor [uncultured Oscillibacter sp.]|uniref:RNA polymerase sigma factor n=1 Tax=uncultured Oscillibacter sp. TaxID=876091 RepID=UPI00260716E2|nr:sigma-70 family RNA polymerase sigma factor [uncultured Oscillibacter sp.]
MLTEQQFTDAAERYLDMVYRIALNWFRSPADAEDAAQNAMLRLWQTDTEFRREEHLRYWLVRTTLNECKRISGHPWRKRMVSLENCPEPVFSDPARQTLFQEVMELPMKYRLPLYLYYYEGYSVDEVGEMLRLKASTVQTRLARGRAKLRTQLEEV